MLVLEKEIKCNNISRS